MSLFLLPILKKTALFKSGHTSLKDDSHTGHPKIATALQIIQQVYILLYD